MKSLHQTLSLFYALLLYIPTSTVQSFQSQQLLTSPRQPQCRLFLGQRPSPWEDNEEDIWEEERRPPPRYGPQPAATAGMPPTAPRPSDGMPIRRRPPPSRRNEESDLRLEDDRYDFYDEEDEEGDEGGNFWSNPPARYDEVPPKGRVPRPNEPPRERRRPQRARNGSERRRKSTFRSGTPPPIPVVGDFYNQLFWYGFDPNESNSPADKTMFGGTKGKFNGLSYLYDDDDDERGPRRRRRGPPPPQRNRPRRQQRRDDYWNDEGEDDYFEGGPPRRSNTRMEDNLQPDFKQQRRKGEQTIWQGGDVMGSEDGYAYNGRSSRQSVRGGDWAANKVASWWKDLEGDDYIGLRDDQYEDSGQDNRPPPRRRQPPSSPFGNVDIFTSFFGGGPRDRQRDRKAEMYDRQMGINDKGFQYDGGRRGARRPPNEERRKGYAYRYDKEESEEDDGEIVDADVIVSDIDEATEAAEEEAKDEATDEDEKSEGAASVQERKPKIPNQNQRQQKRQPRKEKAEQKREQVQSRQSSWEQRQQARERIPPAGVAAWGPNGDLGMDAQMKAYTDAMQDVRDAEFQLEQRKKREEDTIEDMRILRVDIGMATRRVARNQDDKSNLNALSDQLEETNYRVRRATQRVQFAERRLQELKDWYGPLLTLYSPSKAEQSVDDALREFQEEEQGARPQSMAKETDDDSSARTRPPNFK